MFTSLRSAKSAVDSSNVNHSKSVMLTLQCHGHSVLVGHDGFSIGSSRQCDLSLAEPSIPALHSIIHSQAGAIWIEAADDASILLINDRPVRRMALRHDDRMRIGDTEFTILMHPESITGIEATMITEDLTLLTAEELCDRILSEQSMVAEFADGQRSGWEALLRAIEAANDEPIFDSPIDQRSETSVTDEVTLDTLLEQIQELNETITDRTRELSDREAEVLESTSMLEETQQMVSERIDEILVKLDQSNPPDELRASA